MASAEFIAKMKAQHNKPRIKVLYDSGNITTDINGIAEIGRNANLEPGFCTLMLDNRDNGYDDFFTVDDEFGKKLEVKLGFGSFATKTASTISFHDNDPDPDTIEDSGDGLVMAGFVVGSVITVDGSDDNDGSYTITAIEAGAITVAEALTNEVAGDSITIATEELDLFTGYVEEMSGYDYRNKTVQIIARDKLARLLDKKIIDISGDNEYGKSWNFFLLDGTTRTSDSVLSNTVWEILTEYGDFDDTASTANTDIDYASWAAWATEVDDGGYSIYDIGVHAFGETVRDILLRITELSNSIFWVGGDGKLRFYACTQTNTGQEYTTAYASDLRMRVTLDGRENALWVGYGYQPAFDVWQSDPYPYGGGMWYDSSIVGPSTDAYIYQTIYEKDRAVFHNTPESAEIYTTAKLARQAAPIRWIEIETDIGFLEDISNTIILTDFWDTEPHDDIDLVLTDVRFNIAKDMFMANLKGYYAWGEGELA